MKIIKKISKASEPTYSSKGFALIYEDSIFERKIVNRKLNNDQNYVLHPFLKNDTLVSISNPFNSKSLTAKVKKTFKYPSIYNVVITKKMADNLDLDINNPYVEVLTIKKNNKFVAKEASIFDEEKNVANKAPVEGISIKNLNENSNDKDVKKKRNIFSYIIKIADFYFKDSAKSMVKKIKEETKLNKVKIMNISNTAFRVYIGPYKDLNSLQKAFNDINIINFENLELIKQ